MMIVPLLLAFASGVLLTVGVYWLVQGHLEHGMEWPDSKS